MKNKKQNPTPNPQHSTPKNGRPSKLTDKVVHAFKAVLAEDLNALVCTDEELFFLLNLRLQPDEQISYRSFQRYKAKAIREDDDLERTGILEQLYILFRKAMIKQKAQLVRQVMNAKEKGWSRFQWILERKFRDFNWRKILEQPPEDKVPFNPATVIVPSIHPELMGTLKFVEDRPLITLDEWHEKWGHSLEKYQ